tara:strand:- start:1824 stop:2654 length:831 start_codon:yes stop_codon:yes gene_type:complete
METKIKSHRTFGVEIELLIPNSLGYRTLLSILEDAGVPCSFEGYTHRVMNTWKLVTDSSLNTSRGYKAFELVSPICQGQNSINELRTILNLLEETNCRVNKSCGIHVHVGIQDYSVKNLTNLIKFYGKYEEEINMVVAPSRRDGRWAKAINVMTIWNNLNKCETFSDVENIMYTRYKTVNVFSYRRYGTVEFRQHGGSIDANKVCSWVIMLTNMCDKVAKKKNVVKTKSELKHSLVDLFGNGHTRKIMKFFCDRAVGFGFDEVEGIFDWATTNRKV